MAYDDDMRPIVNLKMGPDGLWIEPENPDWVMMKHNADRAAYHFNYADEYGEGNPDTYDPAGDYNCGRCNQFNGGRCLLVDIKNVNPIAGSCEDWESIRASDPELNLKRKKPEVANYGVAENGVGFGCHRCPFSKHAQNVDPMGRTHWCGELAFYITPTGCCTNNGAETTDAPVKYASDEDREMKEKPEEYSLSVKEAAKYYRKAGGYKDSY